MKSFYFKVNIYWRCYYLEISRAMEYFKDMLSNTTENYLDQEN